jgi:hypothetical protein
MMRRAGSSWALPLAIAVTASTLVGGACNRQKWPGPKVEPTAASAPAAMAPEVPADDSEGAPFKAGAHPRILLTRDRLDALEALARTPSPIWAAVVQSCTETANGKADSGYEGEDWASVTLDLALCGRVLSKPELTRAAIRYWVALLDDKETVGDGHGALAAVQGNDGYSIRNRGFLAAIAYDWLYDALSAEQRKHGADRFHAFCKWYQTDGYKHDDPIANHYMGYFGACAMGGLALEGDDPRGAEMRRMARTMWNKEIRPAYARLAGGDFPEGWQYARIPGAALAFYVDAEARAGHPKIASELPWLRESVAFQTHALHPDGVHLWDNADWSKKPARPFPAQLYAAALALGDDPAGKHALFLARLARRPGDPAWSWLHAIADDPARKGEDPRRGAASYLAKGTGTVFARTDWTPGAVWIGMNASPAFGDHQHLDQGHFEVTRGGDALLIDPGDYDSYSTTSHNTLLVDDKHENIRWSPNQGIWGKDVSITRFEDAGRVVYALASFGEAYNPDGYPTDHAQRSVTRAERELVFSRTPLAGAKGPSARLVLYDRVTLTKPSYGVTWAAHAGVTPSLQGATVGITVGASSVAVTTLVPAATPRFLKEPTLKSDEMFTKNDPAEGIASTRIEVASPAGSTERRFLHVIAIGAAGDRPPAPVRVAGEGAEGAAIDGETYVFVSSAPQRLPAAFTYRAPTSAARHVVTGLSPGGKYAITPKAQGALCDVSILPGGTAEASPAGTLAFELAGCAPPR